MQIVVTIEVPDDYGTDKQIARVPTYVAQHLSHRLRDQRYVESITMSVDGGEPVDPLAVLGWTEIEGQLTPL
jgi:hypothetical protein